MTGAEMLVPDRSGDAATANVLTTRAAARATELRYSAFSGQVLANAKPSTVGVV